MLRFEIRLLAVSLLLVSPAATEGGDRGAGRSAATRSVFATFKDSGGGGVVEYLVDRRSGRILAETVVGQSKAFLKPHKLRLSEDGRFLLATSQHPAFQNLLLADLTSNEVRFLSVERIPDDLAAWGDRFVVGAEDQMAYIVDAAAGKVAHRWYGKHEIAPDGRRIEYVATTPDGTAWTSWQKDSGRGTRKGSRVVAIDIASGKTLADLQMPRSLPQLHLADPKERGPSPEIIIPSPRTNTLLLSMDLYGGIAMADLDAARGGEWKSLSYHSVAPDEGWGTAFPDRAALVPSGAKDFVFVANAGAVGGVSWIDLAERRVVQRLATPPGLVAPALVSGGRLLVSPAAGKEKRRVLGELRETRDPQPELCMFDITGTAGSPRLAMRSVSLPAPAQSVTAIDPVSGDLVLLVAGSEILVVKAATGEIVDRRPSGRKIERVAAL